MERQLTVIFPIGNAGTLSPTFRFPMADNAKVKNNDKTKKELPLKTCIMCVCQMCVHHCSKEYVQAVNLTITSRPVSESTGKFRNFKSKQNGNVRKKQISVFTLVSQNYAVSVLFFFFVRSHAFVNICR